MSAPVVPPIHQSPPREPGRTEDRRQFIKKAAAVAIGALVALIPLAAGLVTFLNPLRRKSSQIEFVRITTLDAVPGDGIPRLFQVVKDRTDAWNRYRNEPVGAVYLRNVEGHLSAHNA